MQILYIASAAFDEPLIKSQVLSYLFHNALHGRVQYSLVTFERRAIDKDVQNSIVADLKSKGINWIPIWISSKNRFMGMFQDIRHATNILRDHLQTNPHDLIHARSFLPGNTAARLKKKLGIPMLYDMRGFWAKEKYAYGRLKFLPAKWVAQFMENRVFDAADHLISLTESGVHFLKEQGSTKPITCIPCCVDLNKFRPLLNKPTNDQHQLVSVGSLGRGYRCDAVFQFAAEYQKLHKNTQLLLLTRTDRNFILDIANHSGFPLDRVTIESVSHEEVPVRVAAATAGICMIESSDAKIASCPTKLGEYLACGLPAIANVPIGDVEDTLTKRNVGIPVRLDHDPMAHAAAKLIKLVNDPNIKSRAREEAVGRFNLVDGANAYVDVYQSMINK
ncbi:MAG: glycosyltransferase [Planctomycetota bacterium]